MAKGLTCIYAGSFDPFTMGHYQIYQQAKQVFDKVIIVIAKNPNKKRVFTEASVIKSIKTLVNSNDKVRTWPGLTAHIAYVENVEWLVRGIRNTSDYMYEEEIAKINAEVNPGLKTVYFRATNDVISSTLVRALFSEEVDIQKYLPYDKKLLKLR